MSSGHPVTSRRQVGVAAYSFEIPRSPALDRYIDAWLLHPVAGTSGGANELESLLRFFSPKVIYEDVPSSSVFEGHKGIEQMCEPANQWSSDLDFNVLTRQTNGSLFSFETETVGTNTSTLGDSPQLDAGSYCGVCRSDRSMKRDSCESIATTGIWDASSRRSGSCRRSVDAVGAGRLA